MIWISGWLLCGLIAAAIGAKKGEGCLSFIFGMLLGPIGIVAALLSSGNRRACPFCRELIHNKAVVCPRCQKEVQPEPHKTGIMSRRT